MADPKLDKPWYMATTLETCSAFDVRQKQGLLAEQVKARSVKKKKPRAGGSKLKTPRLPAQYWILLLFMVAVSLSVYILDSTVAVLGFTATAFLLFFFGIAQQGYVRHGLLVIAKQPPRLSKVRRDGQELDIPVHEIVPGDIIIFNEGDYVPADIRLIEVKQLTAVQNQLTGEPLPAVKNTFTLHAKTTLDKQKNMLFAGSYIHGGYGVGVVVSEAADTQLLHAIKKLPVTKAQEKKRFIAACVAAAIGSTLLFLGVTFFAVVGLSALLALTAYYYVTFWLQYVSWVSLYEQCLSGGIRFKTFAALQETAKVDFVIVDVANEPQDLASFIHRLQAELRVEVRAVVPKSDIKAYEQELNISGSALSKAEFMGATRDKKLKQLREYQFLVGFDSVAYAESVSLLRQAGHNVLWIDDAKSPQPTASIATAFISQQSQPSDALLEITSAVYTRGPSLKRLAGLFEAFASFNRITRY